MTVPHRLGSTLQGASSASTLWCVRARASWLHYILPWSRRSINSSKRLFASLRLRLAIYSLDPRGLHRYGYATSTVWKLFWGMTPGVSAKVTLPWPPGWSLRAATARRIMVNRTTPINVRVVPSRGRGACAPAEHWQACWWDVCAFLESYQFGLASERVRHPI